MSAPQVNLRDGTHMPCDRLRESTKMNKNLKNLAEQRLRKEKMRDEALVAKAMDPTASRGHPLRKDGFYTKYLWKPFHQRTIEERFPAAKKAEAEDCRQESSSSPRDTSAAGPQREATVVLEARAQE